MVSSWERLIDQINRGLLNDVEIISKESLLELCEGRIQRSFPGPYQVILCKENGAYRVALRFDDPEEEIMWKLRWG
jgi:hypothetical protein